MSLRIIAGEFRGRLLKAPKGVKTRPTLAIMRKAVFDMLQPTIDGARFLDLFAGSGLMGIEALSRGAAHVTFVDNDRTAMRCIEENLTLLSLQKRADVFLLDAASALKACVKKQMAFDVIYIDPPYALSQGTSILKDLLLFIDAHALLAEEGVLLIEESAPPTLPDKSQTLKTLQYMNTRQFSDSILHKYISVNTAKIERKPNFRSFQIKKED
jgi:16S rRNA (guanine(966)-N(2))-methyltransferase RsmD